MERGYPPSASARAARCWNSLTEWDEGRQPKERNPDGVSLMGCNYIYAPSGQAGEYAPLAANPYRGCGHACAYCYVPAVIKIGRAEFDAGAEPRPDFMKHLRREAAHYQNAGITEQVMLSFTSDPYHPGDTTLTRETLIVLRDHGLEIGRAHV